MQEKEVRKRGYAKKLLNTLSVDSIIDVIHQINASIISLINSSSDDFLYLHSKFMQIHELIKQEASGASAMLNAFTGDGIRFFIRSLTESTEKLKISVAVLIEDINISTRTHNEIVKILDHLYIPVNNYNQNLKTLSLLCTNFQFDSETVHYGKELCGIIKNIHQRFPEYPNRFNKIRDEIIQLKNTLETIQNDGFQSVYDALEYIPEFVGFLSKKHIQAQQLKLLLNKKMIKSSEHASKIITHLQYQDIVKQKIEHIEQTHYEILEKLMQLNTDNDHPNYVVIKAKLLIHIRDVSGLQAAQLVYANKEYQNAIEIITNKYFDLVDLVQEVIMMCKKICDSGKGTDENLEKKPEEILKKTRLLSSELKDKVRIQIAADEVSHGLLSEFSMNSQELCGFAKSLQECVMRIPSKKYPVISSSTIKNLVTVADEFVKTVYQIAAFSGKCISLLNKNQAIQEKKTVTLTTITHEVEKLKVSIREIIDGTDIFNIYKTALSRCEISDDLLKSVRDLKYYELFEKEIEKIILSLNDISQKLHVEENIISKADRETLEFLKKRYTVSSEYLVHEHISNESRKGSIDLFETDGLIPEQNEDSSDNELELF